ncbi:MAG: hypothetical protein R3195_05485 [Gemmatimonadota bacterium]|nr:hypothetical protein [Gemmatimonadota bacterium]
MTGAAPALTGKIWWILFRNEWFKARKRLAFLLPLGFYVFIAFGNYFSSYREAARDPERSFALPGAWREVLGDDMSTFFLIFASVCLVMLVSSEFTWRTARQNVIDGVSKTQWFVGKAMLVPLLAVLFIGLNIVIGATFAALGTDGATGPMIPVGVWRAVGALFLAYCSLGGLALFISLAVRGAGGAMAVWFLWIGIIEQLIIPQTLGRIDAVQPLLQYQPFVLAQTLLGFEKWDPATFQRLVDAAREAGEEIPLAPDMTTGVLVTAGWAVALLVGAFIIFRRRDL